MRVLLVTSPNNSCGIREYGRMLMDAVTKGGSRMLMDAVPKDGTLEPAVSYIECASGDPTRAFEILERFKVHLVHLNHHQALHSPWTEDHIREIQLTHKLPVVVTHHDTFESMDILRARQYSVFTNADCVVVHEPVHGLSDWGSVYYIHQPVLEVESPQLFIPKSVGVFGFDFAWKNFDLVRSAAAACGWQFVHVNPTWVDRQAALTELSWCHVVAFMHEGGGSGTSGAIRFGIGSHRPVIANPGCRQFRDLLFGPAVNAIYWTPPDELEEALRAFGNPSKGVMAETLTDQQTRRVKRLAERDSWTRAARVYHSIYETALARYGNR